MPYVARDTQNRIVAVHREECPEAAEFLPATDPDVLNLLFAAEGKEGIQESITNELNTIRLSDLSMVRVIEDLIELLIEKHVIALTDLPQAAINKMTSRQRTRQQLEAIGGIFT